jgi:hypothetical protein
VSDSEFPGCGCGCNPGPPDDFEWPEGWTPIGQLIEDELHRENLRALVRPRVCERCKRQSSEALAVREYTDCRFCGPTWLCDQCHLEHAEGRNWL